jgi:hypothetical protein
MDADFSVELGQEDPVLDFPWTDPSGKLTYVDLKRHPESMASIAEALQYPELGRFLRTLNADSSVVETAKCDVWKTAQLNTDEEIHDAAHKTACYVDILFSDVGARLSLSEHEQFARKLLDGLRLSAEIPASAEICVRRCFFGEGESIRDGFYCTLYVSGFGSDGERSRRNWEVGLKYVADAIKQLGGC